eukprot:scaffold70921_cov64-Phaeocystis_antarctica.AAC.1
MARVAFTRSGRLRSRARGPAALHRTCAGGDGGRPGTTRWRVQCSASGVLVMCGGARCLRRSAAPEPAEAGVRRELAPGTGAEACARVLEQSCG